MGMRLSREHEALLAQFVRYGLTGGLTTIVNIGVYWILAARGMDPNIAWAFGYVAAVLVEEGGAGPRVGATETRVPRRRAHTVSVTLFRCGGTSGSKPRRRASASIAR